MKLSVDLSKLAFLKKAKLNTGLVLWVFLGFVVLMVGLVIYGEIRKITTLSTDENAAKNQITRVNQDLYNKIDKRLKANASFIASPEPHADVFSAPPKPKDSH